MIWPISFHINVIEFSLWSCGLIRKPLKSWHILRNFRKICIFGDGSSDDHMIYHVCRDVVVLILLKKNPAQKIVVQNSSDGNLFKLTGAKICVNDDLLPMVFDVSSKVKNERIFHSLYLLF